MLKPLKTEIVLRSPQSALAIKENETMMIRSKDMKNAKIAAVRLEMDEQQENQIYKIDSD
jgi:hypothetical protein